MGQLIDTITLNFISYDFFVNLYLIQLIIHMAWFYNIFKFHPTKHVNISGII